MGFIHSSKKLLINLGKSTSLVLAGITITLIGIVMILVLNQPDQNDLNKIKLQYTVKYIQSEQARLGVDCHTLRKTLGGFLVRDIHPVLQSHQSGQDWIASISQDTIKRMEGVRNDYFSCGILYRAAQSVQWDEFKDVDFTTKLDNEISILNTLVRFGEFGKKCDVTCLDQNFHELQNTVDAIERRLSGSSPNP